MENQDIQLITQRFDAVTTLMTSQFKGVNDRLDKINGRVGKTEDEIQLALRERGANRQKQEDYFKEIDELYEKIGDVAQKESQHIQLCPVAPKLETFDKRIRTLEDTSLALCPVVPKLGEMNKRIRVLEDTKLTTITKKNLAISILSILAIIITITLGSIQINETLRAKQTNKIIQQNDSTLLKQIKIYESVKTKANEHGENIFEPPIKVKSK